MKIKPEETIQIQGPYGEINGILTPCIEENTAAPVLVWHMDSEVQWMAAAERLF